MTEAATSLDHGEDVRDTSYSANIDAPMEGDATHNGATSESNYRFSQRITVLSDPTGVESSAVGALRNHLMQQHLGLGRRSLAVCSVGDDVDRTLVSANLAVAAARSGASTVLVDANLRDPQFEKFFAPPQAQPGLVDFLSGTVTSPADIVRNEVLPNLSLIHAGSAASDPQALLAGRAFEDLIAGLMRSFDFTIVDCPSARHSADARRVASVVRYALVIVKQDVTYVKDVKRLIDDLASDRVSVVGTFLNVG